MMRFLLNALINRCIAIFKIARFTILKSVNMLINNDLEFIFMMEVLISGYGRMGRMIEGVLQSRGLACSGKTEDIQSVDKETAKRSICIDFTVPDAFRANYKFIAENFAAAVVGTTGWYDISGEVFAYFEKCGTPLVWASNFSVGVNVFSAAVDMVSRLLAKAGGYAPYIVEKHHCHKLDAPSGTAKTLAADIDRNMGVKTDVASVRVGELAGIHTVGFEGGCDRITIEHEAFTRRGFAEGAVMAAGMAERLLSDTGRTRNVYEFRELFIGNAH